MTTEIIQLKDGATTETLKLNDNNLWYSSEKHKTLEKMQTKVEKNDGKFLNYHGVIDYNSVTKIKLNEKSDKVILSYPNKKGKEQELDLQFEEISTAHSIGEFIASKTNLEKAMSTESKSKTLMLGLLWPIGILAATCFIAFGADMGIEQEGYSRSARRSRSAKAIINLLHDKIGQNGILIIGALITAILIYNAWKRYNNPVNDIIYT